jgi:NAD(P)-dependent dehydrogenase (short-subunit alcohol dehydrogenase family)
MTHYYLSVTLLDLLARAGDQKMLDGSKGRDHGRGVVVITSSTASLHNATNVDMMSYATTKKATDRLVSLLAAKFSRWYVRVCGVNPGCKLSFLNKGLWNLIREVVPSNVNPMGIGSDVFGGLVEKTPAKRAGGLDDLAGVVLFLVSKAGAYVHGISVAIDGGRTLFANGQV